MNAPSVQNARRQFSELQYSPVTVLPNQDQLQTMKGRCISNNLPIKLILRSITKR